MTLELVSPTDSFSEVLGRGIREVLMKERTSFFKLRHYETERTQAIFEYS